MKKITLSALLAGLLLFCFSQKQEKQPVFDDASFLEAETIFHHARQMSDAGNYDEALQAKADELFQQALKKFTALLITPQFPGRDSQYFYIHAHRGYINYYFDSTADAKRDFSQAIMMKPVTIRDSALFASYLYTGAIYHAQNQFDSALYFYKKAEDIESNYPHQLAESERLYNRLGASFYEMGNYRQASNYFEKALSQTDPSNKTLETNYKINLASLLIKLEEYDPARSIYESLLPSRAFENQIWHNLGIISIRKQQYDKAIALLKKVKYDDSKDEIDLYYNFGIAYSAKGDVTMADSFFKKAIAKNELWNGKEKNTSYGLILKYLGDQETAKGNFTEALFNYQLAITNFYPDFNETNPSVNPDKFTGSFSFINLFNTLNAKAIALEKWYTKTKDATMLVNALNAYIAAFKLAAYVEKTYDSDEARLFLGKIKHIAHDRPIELSLQLYELKKEPHYLEQAYFFDQWNKASALAFTVRENQLKKNVTGDDEFIAKERSLKTDITRLSLQALAASDSAALATINTSIRDRQIELGKLQEKLHSDPAWQQQISIERVPVISHIKKMLDAGSALLSYHLSAKSLIVFIATSRQLTYRKLAIDSVFFTDLSRFKTSLQAALNDDRADDKVASKKLYEILIKPLYPTISSIKRLVIIPDDELNGLPFEALRNEQQHYLIENFSILYQYSTALLDQQHARRSSPILAMAPFANFRDSTGALLNPLPGSMEEVSGLRGTVLADSAATKKAFLELAGKYPVIHLATHASADNENPDLSYIAFYPSEKNYRIYAPEIANLDLSSTHLVILSACETGAGQLIKGEGLMSLSRSFAYAGCGNVVTSLWKAEDQTTAYLVQRIHYYLARNLPYDEALRYAKLDFLRDKNIDPRLKMPGYWAHIIFIGEYESAGASNKRWWLIGILLIASITYIIIKRKSLLAGYKQA